MHQFFSMLSVWGHLRLSYCIGFYSHVHTSLFVQSFLSRFFFFVGMWFVLTCDVGGSKRNKVHGGSALVLTYTHTPDLCVHVQLFNWIGTFKM